jgi:hypothetical protein
VSEICNLVHLVVNECKQNYYPFDVNNIPLNGIYILFEKNEIGHQKKRVVRVGTHTGDNQLRSRIQQHFCRENKDRSIFRKNIGRAILNKINDPFLEQWNWDLTTRKAKEKYSLLLDHQKQSEIEKLVTEYITNNFSFVVFPISTKEERLFCEARMISTISLCNDCGPSSQWLGKHSPILNIRRSGLWQVNELFKNPFSLDEFDEFLVRINR